MKKTLLLITMVIILASFVSAAFNSEIKNDYVSRFGSGDVVEINDYQLTYFYEGDINKVRLVEKNITTEVNETYTEIIKWNETEEYTVHVYRAVLIEFYSNDPWNYKTTVISEVVV